MKVKHFDYRDISEWLCRGCDVGVFKDRRDPEYAKLMLNWVESLKEWKD